MTLDELSKQTQDTVSLTHGGARATAYRWGTEWDSRFWHLSDFTVLPPLCKDTPPPIIYLVRRSPTLQSETGAPVCLRCAKEQGQFTVGTRFETCARHLRAILFLGKL